MHVTRSTADTTPRRRLLTTLRVSGRSVVIECTSAAHYDPSAS